MDTAWFKDGGIEIWAPTQSAKSVLQLAMTLTGLAANQIVVHTMYLGGGLGRKAETDFVSQAIQVAMAIGKPVKLTITSEDVLHSFSIPAFRVKSDAVPGRYTTLWFQPTKPGIYHIFCTEYCGTEHSRMIGKITVQEEADYQKWLSEKAELGDAVQGRKLFSKLQCVTCHAWESQARAPSLEEIYMKRIPLAYDKGSPVPHGATALADENYLRESIRYPSARIAAGFQYPSIMPAYDESLVSEDELFQVIAYIKSLKKGQTPARVEQTTVPSALGAPTGRK